MSNTTQDLTSLVNIPLTEEESLLLQSIAESVGMSAEQILRVEVRRFLFAKSKYIKGMHK